MLRSTRIRRARRQAQKLWPACSAAEKNHHVAQQIENRLRPGSYLKLDEGLLITEIGYVTMAISPAQGQCHSGVIVVAGVDHLGAQGFLVLHPERAPFHSLAQTPEGALLDASAAHQKADAIVAAFGSRAALKAAVQQVPWYTMSTVTDLENSGLCQWGAHSFLRRFGLYTATYRVGLPRLLFKISGAYGDRVTAATLLRKQQAQRAKHAADLNAESISPVRKNREKSEPQSGQAS